MDELVERLRTINIFLQPEPSEDLRTFLRENDALRLEAATELSRLTRELAELREAARPFVLVLERDISADDADADRFVPMLRYNRAPHITAGDFRRLATAAKEG